MISTKGATDRRQAPRIKSKMTVLVASWRSFFLSYSVAGYKERDSKADKRNHIHHIHSTTPFHDCSLKGSSL